VSLEKFKNVNGVWLLREIFFETALNKDNVLYTLKQEDHAGFPSLYQLYMDTNDQTEYLFAVTHLGGWQHWKALSEASFFKSYITEWREELEIRSRSIALAKIIETANGKTKDAYAAQKFVANKEWDKAKAPARGRPSNAQVKQAANDFAAEQRRLTEDLERLVTRN
jgi:hypothetical protein